MSTHDAVMDPGDRRTPPDAAGARLPTAVVDEPRWTASVDSTHLGVAAHGGAVTTTGQVDSYPEKRATCWSAPGVTGVLSHLRMTS